MRKMRVTVVSMKDRATEPSNAPGIFFARSSPVTEINDANFSKRIFGGNSRYEAIYKHNKNRRPILPWLTLLKPTKQTKKREMEP